MRTLLILFISVCFINSSFAQKKKDIFKAFEYYDAHQYDKAATEFERNIPLLEKRYGANDTAYLAPILYFTGFSFQQINNFIKAESYYKKCISNYDMQNSNSADAYFKSMEGLGKIYVQTGDYTEAVNIYEKMKKIKSNVEGPNTINFSATCNNLATVYEDMGKFEEAEKLYKQSLEILENLKGKYNEDYVSVLSNLALLYINSGRLEKAEPLVRKAFEICKAKLGNSFDGYSSLCNTAGLLNQDLGNYEKAEKYFTDSKTLDEKTYGKEHFNYVTDCNNLGSLYSDMSLWENNELKRNQLFEKAEKLYLESKTLSEKIFGNYSQPYATACNNLAQLYENQGALNPDFDVKKEKLLKAADLYRESKKVIEKILGKTHPYYAATCNNLGSLYMMTGEFNAAEPLLLESKQMLETTYEKTHSSYGTVLARLGILYYHMGKKDKSNRDSDYNMAYKYIIDAINISNFNIEQNFAFLPEDEKENYLQLQSDNFDGLYNFGLSFFQYKPEITVDIYNQAVKNKGLLLKSSSALRNAIFSSNDDILIEMFEEWVAIKKDISVLRTKPTSQRITDINKLEQEASTLENRLSKYSKDFNSFSSSFKLNFSDVHAQLKENEAIVEFINFRKTGTDSVIYCALIVTKEKQYPKMIRLFNEKQLKALISFNAANDYEYVAKLYGKNGDQNSSLYKLIWEPLEKALGNKKNLIVSPVGLLHKISFYSLSKDKNIYLCDNYNLNMQTNTTNILLTDSYPIDSKTKVSIFGGIDYNSEQSSSSDYYKGWSYLKGTMTEGNEINRILNSKVGSVSYFSKNNATEAQFKENATNSQIFHIATHGFFYPEPKEKPVIASTSTTNDVTFRAGSRGYGVYGLVKSPNPMMRSGLAMAGANDVWNKDEIASDDDGVLTAQEVAELDMRNSNLVVLSACETGLGDIKGSEGVYGLQRAFKMAGVDYIIMSLWQVADKETSEFMSTFYEMYLETQDIEKAFTVTQNLMRKKYDPYFWGAFVLLK